MRSPTEMIRYSSIRFLLFRAIQKGATAIQNALFQFAWRGALGGCGPGTRIDAGVILVLPRNISIGSRSYLASGCQLTTERNEGHLTIGDRAVVAPGTRIDYTGGVRCGNDALISEGVRIYTHDHDTETFKQIKWSPLDIGDHVWVGAGAIVLPAVTKIGSGAVIGAGSVVTKNVEPRTVVAGNPAKVVGTVGSK